MEKGKRMRRKLGTICMVLGTMLVLAALLLTVWNRREARQADRSAQAVLSQIYQELEHAQERQTEEQEASGVPDSAQSEFAFDASAFQDPIMTEMEIDGYNYIGYLSIPSLDLELPVMSEWDYRRLRIAPCRYAGSTKTDNLVIMAHNYARHFGNLTQLTEGELVFFTDMDGVASCYEVAEVVTMKPTEAEEMTAGEYALTLFTCTYGGRSRVAVRCDRAEGAE